MESGVKAIATGRLSSSKPNLQNIPINSAEAVEIRDKFVHNGFHPPAYDPATCEACRSSEPETVILLGSHGGLEVNVKTGVPFHFDPADGCPCHDCCYDQIGRVDLDEWRKRWNKPVPASLDILDVGYWVKGEVYGLDSTEQPPYSPPDEYWRKEFAAEMKERGKEPHGN